MKKRISLIVFVSVLFTLVFCGCSDDKKAPDVCGTWRTDNSGIYTITTFTADGQMNSRYSISNKEKTLISGISQEILDTMETNVFYKVVSHSEMTEEELKKSHGKHGIKTYQTREDMQADKNGDLSYYEIEKGKLVINDSTYEKYDG